MWPRGLWKESSSRRAIDRLDGKGVPRFDVAELHGLVHADAATGLRDLARQLDAGRRRNATSRYVDDLGILVEELRRRRAERRAPLLVILHELDAFALQPRQTLLYVLLDAMQSRLGCVIVCGITRDHASRLSRKREVDCRTITWRSILLGSILCSSSRTGFDCVEGFEWRFGDSGGVFKRPRDEMKIRARRIKRRQSLRAASRIEVAKMLDDSVS